MSQDLFYIMFAEKDQIHFNFRSATQINYFSFAKFHQDAIRIIMSPLKRALSEIPYENMSHRSCLVQRALIERFRNRRAGRAFVSNIPLTNQINAY